MPVPTPEEGAKVTLSLSKQECYSLTFVLSEHLSSLEERLQIEHDPEEQRELRSAIDYYTELHHRVADQSWGR